jgi:hypothetical protein
MASMGSAGRVIHLNTVIAHHLVLTGYGHWLSNDPRGSGSADVRQEKLRDLGEVHSGRRAVQPGRTVLRQFYQEAEPRLLFPSIWYEQAHREVIAEAFAQTIAARGYTCWASAICSNHAHLLIRIHHDSGRTMWLALAAASRDAMRSARLVAEQHPVWSARPFVK